MIATGLDSLVVVMCTAMGGGNATTSRPRRGAATQGLACAFPVDYGRDSFCVPVAVYLSIPRHDFPCVKVVPRSHCDPGPDEICAGLECLGSNGRGRRRRDRRPNDQC
jgi:hypothetical protein